MSWTPCCCRAFHSHCLKRVTQCPLCRSTLPRAFTHPGEEEACGDATAVGRTTERRAPRTHYEEALDLAFTGPHWSPQAESVPLAPGEINAVMGTNYGWRTGGPASTLYTV